MLECGVKCRMRQASGGRWLASWAEEAGSMSGFERALSEIHYMPGVRQVLHWSARSRKSASCSKLPFPHPPARYLFFPLLAALIWSVNMIVTKMSAGLIAPAAIGFIAGRWPARCSHLRPAGRLAQRAQILRHWPKLAVLGGLAMALYQGLAYGRVDHHRHQHGHHHRHDPAAHHRGQRAGAARAAHADGAAGRPGVAGRPVAADRRGRSGPAAAGGRQSGRPADGRGRAGLCAVWRTAAPVGAAAGAVAIAVRADRLRHAVPAADLPAGAAVAAQCRQPAAGALRRRIPVAVRAVPGSRACVTWGRTAPASS